MKSIILFLQLIIVGLVMGSCIHYCNRIKPPYPEPPPVKNICECKCNPEVPAQNSYDYDVNVPSDSWSGVTICCDGCGKETNGTIFCK